MYFRKPLTPWSLEDIDLMIETLSFLDVRDFEYVVWVDSEMRVEDGLEIWSIPYPEYCSELQRYVELCADSSCFMYCYRVFPEDPDWAEPNTILAKVLANERDFESATLNQVRRYFCLCIRGEKFCEGLIGGEVHRGTMGAAYRRLIELRKELVAGATGFEPAT